ncbi:MAG TPA: hypothetical protein PKA41_06050 [Verrucomicrobiota bacterium]|nr:hypothetical protein [Verrucomicrobiota bacterium]
MRKIKYVAGLFLFIGAWSIVDMLCSGGFHNVTIIPSAFLLPIGIGLWRGREACRWLALWFIWGGVVLLFIMLGWIFGRAFGLFQNPDVVVKIFGQPIDSRVGAFFTLAVFLAQLALLPWMYLVLIRDDVKQAFMSLKHKSRPWLEWGLTALVVLIMAGAIRLPLKNRYQTGIILTDLKPAKTNALQSWTDHRRLDQIIAPGSTGEGRYGDDEFGYEILFNDDSVSLKVTHREKKGINYRVVIMDKDGSTRPLRPVIHATRKQAGSKVVEEKAMLTRQEFDRIAAFILQVIKSNAASNSRPVFGPVNERTLPLSESGYSWSLNLESGNIQQMPASLTMTDWSTGIQLQHGIIVLAPSTDRALTVAGTGTQVIPLLGAVEAWQSPSPSALDFPYELDEGQTVSVTGENNLPPATFAFRTKSGVRGVLQITGFTENPRGVRIRYKLVQNVTPASREINARQKLAERAATSPEASAENRFYLVERIERLIAGVTPRTGYDFEIWENTPGVAGEYRIRSNARQIPLWPEPFAADGKFGSVYFLTNKDRFYIQWDAAGASTLHYYGPFQGDPARLLGLGEAVTLANTRKLSVPNSYVAATLAGMDLCIEKIKTAAAAGTLREQADVFNHLNELCDQLQGKNKNPASTADDWGIQSEVEFRKIMRAVAEIENQAEGLRSLAGSQTDEWDALFKTAAEKLLLDYGAFQANLRVATRSEASSPEDRDQIFSPVVEREFTNEVMLDLDSDQVIRGLPATVKAHHSYPTNILDWMRSEGLDIICLEEHGAIKVDVPAVSVPRFDLAADEAASIARKLEPIVNHTMVKSGDDPEQAWVFKTREGGIGMLQITGYTENPRGVKIRYKLVQAGPVASENNARSSRTFILRHQPARQILNNLQSVLKNHPEVKVAVSADNSSLTVTAPNDVLNRVATLIVVEDWPSAAQDSPQIEATRRFFRACALENVERVAGMLSGDVLAELAGTNLLNTGNVADAAADAALVQRLRGDWPGKEAAIRAVIAAYTKYPLALIRHDDPGPLSSHVIVSMPLVEFENAPEEFGRMTFGSANAGGLLINRLPPWFEKQSGMNIRSKPARSETAANEPADLRAAKVQLAELRIQYGEQHPEVQRALARIKELERMSTEEPDAPADLRAARAHLAELRMQYAEQHPEYQKALARIRELERRPTKQADEPISEAGAHPRESPALQFVAWQDEFQFRWIAAEGDTNSPADLLTDDSGNSLRVLRTAILTGHDVDSAGFTSYQTSQMEIAVFLNPPGREKFAAATANNIGRQLAIVWNGKILMAPVVRAAITGGRVSISGRFTDAEAKQLLDVLNHRQPAARDH